MPAKRSSSKSSPKTSVPADDFLLQAEQGHDALTKGWFSKPEHARPLFENHFPHKIAQAIDFDSLQLAPGSFVRKTLHQLHSDLLFQVNWKSPDAQAPLYLYLLFEHKTTPSERAVLQLLEYTMEIWRHEIKATAKRKKSLRKANKTSPEALHSKLTLPVVLPFLLHQGPDKWAFSCELKSLFRLPVGLESLLGEYLPSYRYLLLDLTQVSDDASGEATLEIILRLMKSARIKDQLLDFLEWLQCQPVIIPVELAEFIFIYTLLNQEELDAESIWDKVTLNNPELTHQPMNALQKLISKGRSEGRTEGRTEGRSEGRHEGLGEGVVKGQWIGKIQLLEHLMSMEITAQAELEPLDLDALQGYFSKLEASYTQRFRN